MIPADILLYVFVFVTVGFSIYIVFSNNVLNAAFALLGTLLGVAALYVFAGADFIALTQIVIYVGGTLVLIMFGIMISRRVYGNEALKIPLRYPYISAGAVILVFIILVLGIIRTNFAALDWVVQARETDQVVVDSTVQTIGKNLMTTYLLPFEVAAVLLLIALIGAAYIAAGKVRQE
ncbi:NADH-quinone oxidoreductase subunit J [Cytophagaceae bacterium ABcell3]|nr:NADH-quinone oxidoreductase subunit J [Cytophagaceae bacterium ABcell3]